MVLIVPDWLTSTTRNWNRDYAWYIGYRCAAWQPPYLIRHSYVRTDAYICISISSICSAIQHLRLTHRVVRPSRIESSVPGCAASTPTQNAVVPRMHPAHACRTDTGKYDDDIPGDYLYTTNIYWYVAVLLCDTVLKYTAATCMGRFHSSCSICSLQVSSFLSPPHAGLLHPFAASKRALRHGTLAIHPGPSAR